MIHPAPVPDVKPPFGGWPLLFSVGLLACLFVTAAILVGNLDMLNSDEIVYQNLDHPGLKQLVLTESFALTLFGISGAYVFWLVVIQHESAPHWAVSYLATRALCGVALGLMSASVFRQSVLSTLGSYWFSYASAAIWIPYFLSPKRRVGPPS